MTNLDDDHATAILGLLDANPLLTGKVYDGALPTPRPSLPYVVVYLHIEQLPGEPGNALDGVSAQVTLRATCHCVGGDAAAARAVGFQVKTALKDVTPTIADRSCGQIGQESTAPPVKDETTGVLVMDQVAVYKLITHPAG